MLRRLAASPHRPLLVVTPPDRPKGRGRRMQSPPPAAEVANELGIELLQTASVNDEESLERIRALRPEAAIVCAFGQLIREPLLSEWPLLNIHPSLLPRWRGAAPIERAIMAGEQRTGVCVMQLTEGLDAGPVALREEVAIGSEDDFAALSSRLASLGGDLLVQALDLLAEARLEFAEQDEEAVTYAEKIAGEERRLDPARPAAELAAHRACPHPAHRRLSGDERRRAPRREAGSRRRRRRQDRCGQGRVGGAAARLRPRCPAARGGAAAGWQADGRSTPTCAATRCRSCERVTLDRRDLACPSARLRDDPGHLRARGAHRAAPSARQRTPPGSTVASVPRRSGSAYGAVQRRGTIDAAIERLVDRPLDATARPAGAGGSAPRPLRAPLRRRHARPRRRRPGGRAGQAGGGGARLRLRQRGAAAGRPRARSAERGAARATTRPRRAPRSPTRRRSGWRRCGGEELGPEDARSLLAACNEPAEVAFRVNTLRTDAESVLARLLTLASRLPVRLIRLWTT